MSNRDYRDWQPSGKWLANRARAEEEFASVSVGGLPDLAGEHEPARRDRRMRGASIHIGVNDPVFRTGDALTKSEEIAWKMAELAFQAGYEEIHLLRGAQATRDAVRGLIAGTARSLSPGETLFVSFSGHGSLVTDEDGDEAGGYDETWSLYDGDFLDDELANCWRLAPAGARVLLVAESCFSGGATRYGLGAMLPSAPWPYEDEEPIVYRSDSELVRGAKAAISASCIGLRPMLDDGIQASVLVLAAAGENCSAGEGGYLQHLIEVWNNGAFRGSYCDLHRRLSAGARSEPRILFVGTPDHDFPLEIAFHLDRAFLRPDTMR